MGRFERGASFIRVKEGVGGWPPDRWAIAWLTESVWGRWKVRQEEGLYNYIPPVCMALCGMKEERKVRDDEGDLAVERVKIT